MFFLISEANRYIAKHEINLSTSGLRLCVEMGELKAIRTEGGARVFLKEDLDTFITKRKEKKLAPKLQDAA